jgi:hypothetical protein
MAANHLGVDGVEDIVDGEESLLLGDGGVEKHLEQDVPELVTVLEVRTDFALDKFVAGGYRLIALLDEEGAKRLERLLPVPGTSIGSAQLLDGLIEGEAEVAERLSGGGRALRDFGVTQFFFWLAESQRRSEGS